MAILNLPTFTEQEEKTPEQEILESLQQMQIERLPVPAAEVPRFTRYGNRMAERGGFDVLPQEQLSGMTQQEIDQYEAERRKARGAGISETLLRMGQAFQGLDASGLALERQQARQEQAQQAEKEKLNQQLNNAIDSSNIPETQKTFLKAMGVQQKYDALYKREIIKDISGRQRFVDTGGYVFQDAETPPKDLTEFQKAKKDYNILMNKPVEGRSAEDIRNISILETKLFGQSRVIPFYDSEGNVVESITSKDLILNSNILKEKEKQGLFTVGQSPSTTPKGAKSVITLVRDDYLGAKSQIDTINDLASIIEENKDAFTFAGSLGNLVNSAKYQIQSAERLANLSKLQQNEKEFSDLDNMLDTKYGDILDKISQNRAVAKSIFLRLAYGTAKDIDPSGRLSDNDVKIAMDIIGNLGPNWKANLATLESLANRTQREYNDKYTTRINRVGDDDREEANKYETIPQFLGGRDWRQTSTVAPTTTNVDALVNKYLQPQG